MPFVTPLRMRSVVTKWLRASRRLCPVLGLRVKIIDLIAAPAPIARRSSTSAPLAVVEAEDIIDTVGSVTPFCVDATGWPNDLLPFGCIGRRLGDRLRVVAVRAGRGRI